MPKNSHQGQRETCHEQNKSLLSWVAKEIFHLDVYIFSFPSCLNDAGSVVPTELFIYT